VSNENSKSIADSVHEISDLGRRIDKLMAVRDDLERKALKLLEDHKKFCEEHAGGE